MLGVFLALDLFLFYVFWEVVLVPMYLIIGIWGGANRIYATIKFVIYTLVGSLLMLVAILALAWSTSRPPGPGRAPSTTRPCWRQGIDPTLQMLGLPGPSSWPSPSRCPCGPSTPGCPMPTSRPPRPARSSSPACCSSWAATASSASPCRCSHRPRRTWRRSIIVLSVIGIIYGAIVAIAPAGPEEADRLLLGQPHGLRDPGHLRAAASRASQGAIFQMVAHGIITGALFLLRGRHLRAHPRPHDRQDGRPRRAPAGLRHAVRLLQPGLRRAAWPGRLRGRVPGAPGRRRIPGHPRLRGGPDHHLRGRLPALHGPEHGLRRAQRLPQGPRQQAHRRGPHGGHDARAAGRADRPAGPLPGPRARPHPAARGPRSWMPSGRPPGPRPGARQGCCRDRDGHPDAPALQHRGRQRPAGHPRRPGLAVSRSCRAGRGPGRAPPGAAGQLRHRPAAGGGLGSPVRAGHDRVAVALHAGPASRSS